MWVNMTFGTMLSYCRVPPDAVRGSSCHNDQSVSCIRCDIVGTRRSLKNSGSHIDASHSRQPLVKGERLVRYEVNAVILRADTIFESVNLYIFIMVFDPTIYIYIYIHMHTCILLNTLMQVSSAGIFSLWAYLQWYHQLVVCCCLLPQRVCCPRLCAMPVQHARAPEQAREDTSPEKN